MFTKMLNHGRFVPHLNDNAPFGGTIVDDSPRGEVEIIERVAPTLQQRLMNLHLTDPEQKKKRAEIAGGLATWTTAAESLIEQVNEQRREALDSELESIRARGRNQEKVLAGLRADHESKVLVLKNLTEEAENLSERIKDAKAARLPRYASKETRAAHQRTIAKMQDELRALTVEVARAGQAQMATFQELQEAQAAMKKISDADFRIRGQLSGKPYTDPEFGLVTEPI